MVLFIDSFLFNGEELVKMRVEYLYDFVDYFYIVESIYTHSRIKKDNFYIDICKEWFLPYLDKIRFIKINNILSNIEENSQRNYIREILLNDFNSEDFILALCDVDEFYNKEFYNKDKLFNELNKNVIFLKMNMYYYNFHFFIDNEWTMAFFINSNMLKKYTDLNYIRVNKIPNHTIRHNNGWHFSYFMKPQEIQRKLISFLHNDLNRSPYNNIDYLNFCVKNGIDFLLRDHIKIKKIPFEDPLHSYPELFRKYYNS